MKKYITLSVFTICFSLVISASFAQEQYKRISRNLIADIVDGNIDSAKEGFSNYLSQNPNDLESMFGLAVVYTQEGGLDKAMEYVQQSVQQGLPPQRYLAGPRELLKPLQESGQFKTFIQTVIPQEQRQFVHGPMLGDVTGNQASIWLRTYDEVPVLIEVKNLDDTAQLTMSAWSETKANDDYSAVIQIKNLQPDTHYEYALTINGEKLDDRWQFKTPVEQGYPTQFSVGFGGGAGYTPMYERMWNTIDSHNLQAMLLLGDNVYIDHPEYPNVQRYCYYRRQSRPEFRNLISSTPIYAVWDDHDFTDNDLGGGPLIDEPAWKRDVWNLFKDQWVNPYYGGGEDQPGCWFDFYIGDVHFILLDSRYYRHDPREVEDGSMLGTAQKEWLLETLENSEGTFKVLASPVPWAEGAKPGSLDPWQGFPSEREEIFSFIHDNKINGVVLISADRHRSDIWKINRDDGYDFYEFESSRLSNIHTHRVMDGSLFGYNEKCSFGKITFNTQKDDPELAYEIYSIDNEQIFKITLKHSQMMHNN